MKEKKCGVTKFLHRIFTIFFQFQLKVLICSFLLYGVASASYKAITIKCPRDFVGLPPNCTAVAYIPETPEKLPQCEAGTYGQYPKCHKPCPVNFVGIYPDCERARCPPGANGTYWPDCFYQYCPFGKVGIYPDCHDPVPWHGCAPGLLGYPPNCYKPCKPYCELIKLILKIIMKWFFC